MSDTRQGGDGKRTLDIRLLRGTESIVPKRLLEVRESDKSSCNSCIVCEKGLGTQAVST